jgi:tyrosine-protein phosphatase YwqE
MMDIHSHILIGMEDDAESMEAAFEMPRLAVADGIRIMEVSPHLFRNRVVIIGKNRI